LILTIILNGLRTIVMLIKPSAVLCACLLLLAACAGDANTANGRPQVVASFYPFAFVAEQVGGDLVDVENLTQPGAEPHDLELTPQQVADLTDATLVVYERGFQPAVDDGVDQADLPGVATVDVADIVDLVPASQHGIDPDSEEGGGLDPHIWLDPVAMEQITRAVAGRLAQVDPHHRATYQRNGDRLIGQLRQLDTAYERGLADCRRNTIVTSHDAFGYLADRYGLEQIPIAGIDPNNEPSPAQQAKIVDLVRQDGITTVFTETLVSSDIAESIANETGVAVATLDPIEGLSADTADQTYLTLMRANLDALRRADDCT